MQVICIGISALLLLVKLGWRQNNHVRIANEFITAVTMLKNARLDTMPQAS